MVNTPVVNAPVKIMFPVVFVNATAPLAPSLTAPLNVVPPELVIINVLPEPVTVEPLIAPALPPFKVKLKLPVTAPIPSV